MDGVEINVHCHSSGTSDPGHQNDLVLGKSQSMDRTDQGTQNDPVAASGTIDMGELLVMPKILVNDMRYLCHGILHCVAVRER
jgi:hypothetical protein